MTDIMHDAANPAGVPSDARCVALYVNGKYRAPLSAWARWPNARRLPIQIFIPGVTLNPEQDADNTCGYAAQIIDAGGWVAMDVEAPDVPRARGTYCDRWAARVKRNGFRPVIYTSRSTQFPCAVDWWLAEWTNPPRPHLIPGTVSTQYAALGPYDLSVVVDGFPSLPKGRTVTPTPIPAVTLSTVPVVPTRRMKMLDIIVQLWENASGAGAVYAISGRDATHVVHPQEVPGFLAAAGQKDLAPISPETLANYNVHQ